MSPTNGPDFKLTITCVLVILLFDDIISEYTYKALKEKYDTQILRCFHNEIYDILKAEGLEYEDKIKPDLERMNNLL